WTIIHSRFWKFQVPYLSRHFRVITFDGPGNGKSDRSTDPRHYTADAYADDAVRVLDAVGVERVVAVGVSLGGAYTLRLATMHPDRVRGAVLVAPSLPLAPPLLARAQIPAGIRLPYPEDPQGWDKYNLAYWHDHYEDFLTFFFGEAFSETHSTKAREDAVGWGLETTADVLEAEEKIPTPEFPPPSEEYFDGLTCPVLVIQGTDDHVLNPQVGVEAARLSDGTLISMAGTGHLPIVREPVMFNLVLKDFVEKVSA
ncbi:MAG: alpha/beta fold hydrolase, partial [Acidimicrobiia bacterium]